MRLHWPESTVLFEQASVLLAVSGGAPVTREVEHARPAHDHVLLKFVGIDDRDRADELRGAAILVPRTALPEPEPGEFYLTDLIGAAVFTPDGKLGEIIEIRQHPTLDTLLIRKLDGTEVEQPVNEQWIDEVDVDARRVVLSGTDGLIE